jgi:hypothetical protein
MNSSPNEFTQSTESAKSAQPVPNQVPELQKPSWVAANQDPNQEGPKEVSPPVNAQANVETHQQTVNNSEPESPELQSMRQHPIPPPSEPRQYRAIGLVEGHYQALEEQFTKGTLVTVDGTKIDAVLLGRVMSLVKNHIDLEENHLWVVYPRTRQNNGELHLQIVGIWEPEQLGPNNPDTADSPVSEEVNAAEVQSNDESTAYPPLTDGYFSIRGEVVYQSESEEDDRYIIVKIKQNPRKPSDESKFFKLKLSGNLNGKAVGHFWDLHLKRQGQILCIEQGQDLGLVGPTKRKAGQKPNRGQRPRGGKRFGGHKSLQRPSQKPYKSSTPVRSGPVPKPTIKKRQQPSPEE